MRMDAAKERGMTWRRYLVAICFQLLHSLITTFLLMSLNPHLLQKLNLVWTSHSGHKNLVCPLRL